MIKKLIREKVALDHLERDKSSVLKITNKRERRNLLADKIIEECKEVAEELSKKRLNKKRLIEELGDVLEVIYTMRQELNIDEDDVTTCQNDAYESRGGFEDFYYRVKKA